MNKNCVSDIAYRLQVWKLKNIGVKEYMAELHDAADELGIPDEEMFQFCKEILNAVISSQWSIRVQKVSDVVLQTHIDELELSVRAYNCCKNALVKTVGDFLKKTDEEWLKNRVFNRYVLKEMREKIEIFKSRMSIQT